MGGDFKIFHSQSHLQRFQSTPPYGGRHSKFSHGSGQKPVSIHAPIWGATITGECVSGCCCVSIHAPIWGATDFSFTYEPVYEFQSTPPYGGRRVTNFNQVRFIPFQSTPPYGGRPRCCQWYDWHRWFQSTPPYGGRHQILGKYLILIKFQSTPPYGGRPPLSSSFFSSSAVSIHAPIWGATNKYILFDYIGEGFNPRPHMGGDGEIFAAYRPDKVSIHAPIWGATCGLLRPL